MTGASRRLISNDDGFIMDTGPELLTPERIHQRLVATYAGSPVDTVSWCVGNSEVYHFETNAGERIGDGFAHLPEPRDAWARRNLDHLIAVAGGPLAEVCRQFRAAGLGFFPSVRMNSHYAIPFASPRFGHFRRQHPECLIGRPDEYIPAPSVEHGIRRGLDYKHPAVRQHMLELIGELADCFDVDGIELDYMRHPAFFRVDEGYACRYLMTDFLRRIRSHLDQAGARRGRRLDLLVRVPPTLGDAARLGLDVRAWMQEGLVDGVAAGGGFNPFEMPIGEFVAAARGTRSRVYGSLEALRWTVDEDLLRALATRFWDAGVDGLHLFNYYNAPAEWKRRVLGQLVDRQTLSRRRKRYELDHTDRVAGKEGHSAAFRHAHPASSLPVVLEETLPGGGAVLTLQVADDVETASGQGLLAPCVLGLGLRGFLDQDVLEVAFNQVPLDWSTRRVSDGWTCQTLGGAHLDEIATSRTEGTLLQFDLSCPPLTRGANQLRLRLLKGDGPRLEPVTLIEVRLEIDYR